MVDKDLKKRVKRKQEKHKDAVQKLNELRKLIEYVDEKLLPNKTQRKIFWNQFLKGHKLRKEELQKMIEKYSNKI